MATKTINGLTVTTSAAAGDFVPIWRASNGDTRKITKANFVGATITGGGTLATAGFTLTLGATSTISGNISGGGTLATAGYTLTLPATGTADLIGVAQTISALKTYSAGINLGDTNLAHYKESTWTPVIQFGGANVGQSYSTQVGTYTRIGNRVLCTMVAAFSNKGSSTGSCQISGLPFTVALSATFQVRWFNMATAYVGMFMLPTTGGITAPIRAFAAATTAGGVAIADTDFNNNSSITATFHYEI